jgi:hypothetical protein
MVHAGVADVKERQHAPRMNATSLGRRIHSIREGIGQIGEVFEGSGFEIVSADGLVGLKAANGKSVAKHMQASLLSSDQKRAFSTTTPEIGAALAECTRRSDCSANWRGSDTK